MAVVEKEILVSEDAAAAPAAGGTTTEVLRFFNWALHQGEPIARELDYAPVPRTVVDALPSLWGTLRDSSGKRLWTEDR